MAQVIPRNPIDPGARAPGAQERRWLVLAQDGRHVTLGRESDPSADEIARCGESLDRVGTPGWLVVSEGGYYNRRTPVRLLMVRQITAIAGEWPEAERQWHEIRQRALSPTEGRRDTARAGGRAR